MYMYMYTSCTYMIHRHKQPATTAQKNTCTRRQTLKICSFKNRVNIYKRCIQVFMPCVCIMHSCMELYRDFYLPLSQVHSPLPSHPSPPPSPLYTSTKHGRPSHSPILTSSQIFLVTQCHASCQTFHPSTLPLPLPHLPTITVTTCTLTI